MATLNIGPKALSTGSKFLLSSDQWYTIQVYVQNAMGLPTTGTLMRTSLLLDPSDSIDPFTPLISAYAAMKSHCTDWQNTYFPATVGLADDVYHYSQKAKVYYGALSALLPQLIVPNPDPTVVKQFAAICTVLKGQADAFASSANGVAANISIFANNCTADQSVLNGPTGLVKHYQDLYGSSSDEVTNLTAELNLQHTILDAANAEYNKDRLIAETTPTYLVIPFYGWIAAPIVAGIYAKKAVDALHDAETAQHQIGALNTQLQRDARLIIEITRAQTGIDSILANLTAMLPVITQIKGIWSAIASDLGAIVDTINNDVAGVPAIIADLGIDEAISQWQAVGQEANDYRVNAYVTFQQPQSLAA